MSVATQLSYEDFLRAKVDFNKEFGFDCELEEINPVLKPHQRDITQWAVKGGRRAVFANFGLGKSNIQLETSRIILDSVGGRGLIVCPLGVRLEFVHDATKLLGMPMPTFIRRSEEIDSDGLYLTNYQSVRDGKLDPNLFTTASLDEASVLRSYGSKTYQTFLTLFSEVPYRFVATATPSPNRYKELIHYAGFLGVMDTGECLTRFFQRDSTQANNLTLYPHKVEEFHLWLNTWACFLSKPSDLGFSNEGYDLPPLEVIYHEVAVDHSTAPPDRDGQRPLFRGGAALGVSSAAREKRDTLTSRIDKMMEAVDAHLAARAQGTVSDQIIIWCDLNAEQAAIESALKVRGLTYSSVYGSLSPEETERRIEQWRNRETYALIGKPVMLGQGMNLQQCNTAIFVGVTYKFNDLIQANHRIQRYGQERQCYAHIIHAESEREVVVVLQKKWKQHEELTAKMSDVIREHGLNPASIDAALTRSMGVDRIERKGKAWTSVHNDCVLELRQLPDDMFGMHLTSIPFAYHYEYSPSYNDFGHTDSNEHFWAQMDYLTPEMFRTLQPGRIYACHVKDRVLFGNVTGAGIPTISPFHAEAIMHGIKHGFDYMGMVTIVRDVVRENNQTYRLGWTENSKDGTKMGVGSPEYILLFHKPQTDRSKGYADIPVAKRKLDPLHICNECIECEAHRGCYDADCCQRGAYSRARWQTDAHAFWRSSGDRHLSPDELAQLTPELMSRLFTEQTLREVYDYEAHIELGEKLEARGRLPATFMALAPASHHPDVWSDVNPMATLNTEQSRRSQTMHICPLAFDIVDRLIGRYTNPGDLICDPFGGLATVALRAVMKGRRGYSIELNPDYFHDGVAYLTAEDRRVEMPTLFDLVELEAT
jgi:hypothetical protein